MFLKNVIWNYVLLIALMAFSFIGGAEAEYYLHTKAQTLAIYELATTGTEEIKAEFESTIVLSVFHLYDNYTELNKAYQDSGVSEGDVEVWGWSLCEWQPEHNYSGCDIYIVRPKFVDDHAMNTIGHEVWHGVAGEFHE